MPLIPCPDCGRQVSDRAPTCPQCGFPIVQSSPPIISPPLATAPPREVEIPTTGYICESCGEIGWPKTITHGSILIEIVLWLAFIIPGLIYSIWRLTSRTKGCPKCQARMVSLSSPGGRNIAQRFFSSPNVVFR